MKKVLIILPKLILLFLLLSGCKKPFDDIDTSVKDFNPEYAIPLLTTAVDIGNIVSGAQGEASLDIQNDGTFALNFQGINTKSAPLRLFESLPNTTTFSVLEATKNLNFPTPEAMKIQEMTLKNGWLKWEMSANTEGVSVVINSPNIKNSSGISFSKSFKIPQKTYKDSLELRGQKVFLNNGQITLNIDMKDNLGKTTQLKSCVFTLTKYEPSFIKGSMTPREVMIPQNQIRFDFFKKWNLKGNIVFQNPKVTATFDNTFGMPTRVFMDIFEVKDTNSHIFSLKSPQIKNPDGSNTPLRPAFLTLNELGKTKRTIYDFNTSNSNIAELFNAYPTVFNFSSRAIVGDVMIEGFYTDTSYMAMKMDISLPLSGVVKGFSTENTEGVNLSSYDKITDIELKIITDNSIPIDIHLQGYFIDNQGFVMDSLSEKTPLILRGASVNSNGTVARPTEETLYLKFDNTRFKKLLNIKKLQLRYSFTTPNNGTIPIRLSRFQKLNLSIGLKGKIKY